MPKPAILPTVSPTKDELIYIAGFFDGEGIHRLQKKGNRKPCWRFDIVSCKAAQFLTELLPYLRVKKTQAELALKFQESMSTRERPLTDATVLYRESLRTALKQLKE